jgi:hypothetical protein
MFGPGIGRGNSYCIATANMGNILPAFGSRDLCLGERQETKICKLSANHERRGCNPKVQRISKSQMAPQRK